MFFEPFRFGQGLTLRAMTIPTRVITDPAMAAVVALIDVAAEHGRSAHLDRMHDLSLFGVHSVGMTLPISRTMQAKNVGNFQRRPVHGCFAENRFLGMDRLGRFESLYLLDGFRQKIQRAGNAAQGFG